MNVPKEQIKEDAEKEAIELFMFAKKIYKEQTEEYIRHFYNKLSELRAEME